MASGHGGREASTGTSHARTDAESTIGRGLGPRGATIETSVPAGTGCDAGALRGGTARRGRSRPPTPAWDRGGSRRCREVTASRPVP